MARLTQAQLDQAFAKGGSATDAYEKAKGRQQESSENQLSRDAQLSQLITGKTMDSDSKNAMYDKQLGVAKDLRAQYGNETNVDAGDVKIGGIDPLTHLLKKRELSKPQLTPAEETSEKDSGKRLSTYETGGGRTTSQNNLKQSQEVLDQIGGGKDKLGNAIPSKRDWWDRKVGGFLSTSPALMGTFASSEKARRDKAHNVALGLVRQTDSAPTQETINQIMGQIYDPASTDEDNAERLRSFMEKQKGLDSQMNQAANNMSSTGYAMPGLAGNPPRRSPAPQPQPAQGGPDLNSMSDEELVRMLHSVKGGG